MCLSQICQWKDQISEVERLEVYKVRNISSQHYTQQTLKFSSTWSVANKLGVLLNYKCS